MVRAEVRAGPRLGLLSAIYAAQRVLATAPTRRRPVATSRRVKETAKRHARVPNAVSGLPDAAWCQAVSKSLAGNDEWKGAVAGIGEPLFIKVKTDDETSAVLLAVGDAGDQPAVTIHDSETVEGDAIIVSMKWEVWDRLLRGATDLMNAFMSREIKAKASMFKLMKITDPAETLIRLIGEQKVGA